MKNKIYFIILTMALSSQLYAAESNVATITDVKEGVYYLMQDMEKINKKSDGNKIQLANLIQSNKELISENNSTIVALDNTNMGQNKDISNLKNTNKEQNNIIMKLKKELKKQGKILTNMEVTRSEIEQQENIKLNSEIEQFITSNQDLL